MRVQARPQARARGPHPPTSYNRSVLRLELVTFLNVLLAWRPSTGILSILPHLFHASLKTKQNPSQQICPLSVEFRSSATDSDSDNNEDEEGKEQERHEAAVITANPATSRRLRNCFGECALKLCYEVLLQGFVCVGVRWCIIGVAEDLLLVVRHRHSHLPWVYPYMDLRKTRVSRVWRLRYGTSQTV
jgi:hypothetical protein